MVRFTRFAFLMVVACASTTLNAVSRSAFGQEKSTTAEQKVAADERATSERKSDEGWRPLLPDSGLDGWEKTDFGTDAKVYRDGKLLVVEMGEPLNGITYQKKDFPNDKFEIQLEAKRVEGNDFLCGLTFPVGGEDQFCSLIAGGWGGGVVGLSSIDGSDASENQTSSYEEFVNGKWYKFRVRVAPELITVWINDQKLFDQERKGHEFSTRIEVWGSQPLGFCTFQSKVHVRDFVWRPIAQSLDVTDKPKAANDKPK